MKIYIYGTGCGAGDLIDSALPLEKIEGFIESFPQSQWFMGKPVFLPEEVAMKEYDLIIVTSRAADAIEECCKSAKLDLRRVFFLKNNWKLRDRNGTSYEIAKEALGKKAVLEYAKKNRVVTGISDGHSDALSDEEYEDDYVRVKTLELLARKLQEVPGAAAELGVYRGSFARCLNRLFPDRTLYLFDTFQGFDEKELANRDEEEKRTAGEGFEAAHRNTGMDLVRSRLPFPDKAVFCPGLFPQTAEGIDDRFALVSLDVDLEESTLEGLRFFVPRLSEGGYLLLHDYDNVRLPGVRRAFLRYEEECGKKLAAVPLCDRNGTLVITG